MTYESESQAGPAGGRKRFLIADGHAYAYRAFHAIRQLNSPEGIPTNAIYGFIRMLLKLRAKLQPTHWVVVWDGGLALERMKALPEYKAQRPEMPQDLARQLGEIEQFLLASNIPSLRQENVEADDWIAALACSSAASGLPVIIASSDKDFMQLISERVGIINPNDKSEVIWTREQVVARTGVEPGQIVDWLSLIGDTVDNIAGVPGVGPKTASDLLRQFGTIDGLYARLDEVKSARVRSALVASEQIVRRNQRLIRLCEDLPSPIPQDEFAVQAPNFEALKELYDRWGFRGLRQELETTQSRQEMLL